MVNKPTTEEILQKYGKKLEAEIGVEQAPVTKEFSVEYTEFKKEMVPEISRYERWAKSLGNIITLKIAEKDRVKVQRSIEIAHLDITPSQAVTLSLMSGIAVFIATLLIAVAIYMINKDRKSVV